MHCTNAMSATMKTKPKPKTKTTTSHRKSIKINIKLLETIPSGFCCCCCWRCCFRWFYTFSCNVLRTTLSNRKRSRFELLHRDTIIRVSRSNTKCTRQVILTDMQTGKHRRKMKKQTIRKSSEKSKNSAQNLPKTCAKREIDIFVCSRCVCENFSTQSYLFTYLCVRFTWKKMEYYFYP